MSESTQSAGSAHLRSQQRGRRLALGSATSLVARGIHVATMLLVVPMTLTYLGAERYGLWMTITSLLMLLAFADFGLGNGLLNAVATAIGRGDVAGARKAVSTAAVLLTAIAVLLAGLFFVAYPHIPWGWLLNTSTPEMTREGAQAAIVLFLCVAAGLPFAITQRVQAGHEEVHVSNLWQAFASILALLGIWCAVAAEASLPILVAAAAGAPVVTSVAATWYEFGRRRPALRPSRESYSSAEARLLLRSGGLFVVLQTAAMVLGSADNIIVSHALGPKEVTSLAVPARLFAVVPMLVGLAIGPLWPAYAAAKAQGDVRWVRSAITRSIFMAGAVAALVGTSLVIWGEHVIRAWVGNSVTVSTSLLAGLAVWTTLSAIGSAQSIALNGMGVLRAQAACAVVATLLAVIAKILLVSRFGIEGAVWATVPVYFVIVLLPGAAVARQHLAGLEASHGTRFPDACG